MKNQLQPFPAEFPKSYSDYKLFELRVALHKPKTIEALAKELRYSYHYIKKCLRHHDIKGQRRHDNKTLYWTDDFKILQTTAYKAALFLDENGPTCLKDLARFTDTDKRYMSMVLVRNAWLFESQALIPDGTAGRPQAIYSMKFDPFSKNFQLAKVPTYIIDERGHEYFNPV